MFVLDDHVKLVKLDRPSVAAYGSGLELCRLAHGDLLPSRTHQSSILNVKDSPVVGYSDLWIDISLIVQRYHVGRIESQFHLFKLNVEVRPVDELIPVFLHLFFPNLFPVGFFRADQFSVVSVFRRTFGRGEFWWKG